jgi:hypothetical protein
MFTFLLKFLHENQVLVIFEDLTWVAQIYKHRNIQDRVVDLAALFMQAVPAMRQSKKLYLENFPFPCSMM